MLHGDNSFPEDHHAIYDLDGFALSSQNGLERHTEQCQPFPIYIKIFTWPKTFVSGFLLVRWSLSLARERPSRLRRSPNLPSGGPNLPWLFSFPRKKKKTPDRRLALISSGHLREGGGVRTSCTLPLDPPLRPSLAKYVTHLLFVNFLTKVGSTWKYLKLGSKIIEKAVAVQLTALICFLTHPLH